MSILTCSEQIDSQKRLNRWQVCIASVSQPGYGKSDGPAEYCGPKTQNAICDVLHFFRENPKIDTSFKLDQRLSCIQILAMRFHSEYFFVKLKKFYRMFWEAKSYLRPSKVTFKAIRHF